MNVIMFGKHSKIKEVFLSCSIRTFHALHFTRDVIFLLIQSVEIPNKLIKANGTTPAII
jgi:hypothetical protein